MYQLMDIWGWWTDGWTDRWTDLRPLFLLGFFWYAKASSLPDVAKMGCKLGALEQRKVSGGKVEQAKQTNKQTNKKMWQIAVWD